MSSTKQNWKQTRKWLGEDGIIRFTKTKNSKRMFSRMSIDENGKISVEWRVGSKKQNSKQ